MKDKLSIFLAKMMENLSLEKLMVFLLSNEKFMFFLIVYYGCISYVGGELLFVKIEKIIFVFHFAFNSLPISLSFGTNKIENCDVKYHYGKKSHS